MSLSKMNLGHVLQVRKVLKLKYGQITLTMDI